jgi:hypothetical protein
MHEKNARAFVLGFDTGKASELDRIANLIENEIKKIKNPMAVNKGYIDGLKTALSIVKGEIK